MSEASFLTLKDALDLERLITDGIEESLTLDYKASAALAKDDRKRDELCKDVSAFANSAGGQIIYGIEEKDQKPVRVDGGANPAVITREWIEQVLNSRISPRIEGVIITPIVLSTGRAYVITIPQANARAPHQAPDNRYYRRYNFQSVPMADYEVRDMMRRATTPDLYVSLSFGEGDGGDRTQMTFRPGQEVSNAIMLGCTIENRSSQPAYHVIVDVLIDAELPKAFTTSTFDGAGIREGSPSMTIYRRIITSPPALPIFREGNVEDRRGQIAFQVPSSLLGGEHLIDLETTVRTPGFSNTEKWKMHSRGGSLRLCPPGHPLNR